MKKQVKNYLDELKQKEKVSSNIYDYLALISTIIGGIGVLIAIVGGSARMMSNMIADDIIDRVVNSQEFHNYATVEINKLGDQLEKGEITLQELSEKIKFMQSRENILEQAKLSENKKIIKKVSRYESADECANSALSSGLSIMLGAAVAGVGGCKIVDTFRNKYIRQISEETAKADERQM